MEQVDTVLRERWRAAVLRPSQARARLAEIEELEQRYRLVLPDDFRSYLANAAPEEELWDDGYVIWWPVHWIKNLPDEYESPISEASIAAKASSFLVFADYMMWCWAWAICCDDGEDRGRVAKIGVPDRFVADSFSQFVERCLLDPLSVS
jgi:hypothetical protein